MNVKSVRDALLAEVKEGFVGAASGPPIQELGSTLGNLSNHLQALAVCQWLAAADVKKFRDNLARSAFARMYFLRKSRLEKKLGDRWLALSHTEAFFDALAAGYVSLARNIARLSGNQWHDGWEYKDDFFYVLILHHCVMDPLPANDARLFGLLAKYEKACEGDVMLRGKVLKPLIQRDASLFVKALRALGQEHVKGIQTMEERFGGDDGKSLLRWPRARVWIEGLGLLQIAKLRRMKVFKKVPFCPPALQLKVAKPAIEDPFKELEALLARK